MNERVLDHEAPVSAWYIAAFLMVIGCDAPPPDVVSTVILTTPQPTCTHQNNDDRRYWIADDPIRECVPLTGARQKTWKVVDVIWDEKEAMGPFHEITLLVDGTWRDSSGVSGIWRLDERRNGIAFELDEIDAVVCCGLLEMVSERLVLDFASYAPGMVMTLVPCTREL